MTFQRAPPDVNGLGVSTSMPGLTRSAQPVMFFGLPGRTASATTERVTMPFVGVALQSAATSFSSTSFVMSGSSDSAAMSVGRPAMTARAWSPELP